MDRNERIGNSVNDPGFQHLAGGMRLRELAILVLQFMLLRSEMHESLGQCCIRRFLAGLLAFEPLFQLFVAPKDFLQFGTRETPARGQACCSYEV